MSKTLLDVLTNVENSKTDNLENNDLMMVEVKSWSSKEGFVTEEVLNSPESLLFAIGNVNKDISDQDLGTNILEHGDCSCDDESEEDDHYDDDEYDDDEYDHEYDDYYDDDEYDDDEYDDDEYYPTSREIQEGDLNPNSDLHNLAHVLRVPINNTTSTTAEIKIDSNYKNTKRINDSDSMQMIREVVMDNFLGFLESKNIVIANDIMDSIGEYIKKGNN